MRRLWRILLLVSALAATGSILFVSSCPFESGPTTTTVVSSTS